MLTKAEDKEHESSNYTNYTNKSIRSDKVTEMQGVSKDFLENNSFNWHNSLTKKKDVTRNTQHVTLKKEQEPPALIFYFFSASAISSIGFLKIVSTSAW